ncbi:hypothetical protein K402DRAFT_462001 [Aulographum hederae CBS 113979]|uniref:Uncharacterized protein n=1 Tax=Aulographum hederae CBS 113979 TaxID=1176131 RepID=A0A6G1H6F0_9PEZI|nr:hypothetical protein K402DRAFT_462001 [Aulographum hederae CBS 113979]
MSTPVELLVCPATPLTPSRIGIAKPEDYNEFRTPNPQLYAILNSLDAASEQGNSHFQPITYQHTSHSIAGSSAYSATGNNNGDGAVKPPSTSHSAPATLPQRTPSQLLTASAVETWLTTMDATMDPNTLSPLPAGGVMPSIEDTPTHTYVTHNSALTPPSPSTPGKPKGIKGVIKTLKNKNSLKDMRKYDRTAEERIVQYFMGGLKLGTGRNAMTIGEPEEGAVEWKSEFEAQWLEQDEERLWGAAMEVLKGSRRNREASPA